MKLSAALISTIAVLAAAGSGSAHPEAIRCAHWNISGTWATSQGNNYHVTFHFTQTKTVIGGIASLTPQEQAQATYTTRTSKIQGTLIGNHLTVRIRYTKTSGLTLTGRYVGTISRGSLTGTGRDITTPGAQPVSWRGKGPTRCVN